LRSSPHIPSSKKLPEFTSRALALGLALGALLGLGNAFVCFKLGTTTPSSIVAAVLTITMTRLFLRKVSILENNMIQTIASVGEGIAAGVVYVAPAFFMLGLGISYFNLCLLTLFGSILGILFTIPMRKHLVAKSEQHELPFPEGKACAVILKTNELEKSDTHLVIVGLLLGGFYRICTNIFFLWKEMPGWFIPYFGSAHLSVNCSPALLAAGYLVKYETAKILFMGTTLSWLVLNPLIRLLGEFQFISSITPVAISTMNSDDIWNYFVRYIAVGALGMSVVLTLCIKLAKPLKNAIYWSIKHWNDKKEDIRTEKDIPLFYVIFGCISIFVIFIFYKQLNLNLQVILILILFGFILVALSSYGAAVVGTSSDPVSGITILLFLLTYLTFKWLGWQGASYLLAIMCMTIVANVAFTMGAINSQDLKTGHILGATPFYQQIGEIIGVLLPTFLIVGYIFLINKTAEWGSADFPVPQASMIALIVKSFTEGWIPLTLFFSGATISIIIFCFGFPIIPFAIGIYLPLYLGLPFFIGGVLFWLVKHYTRASCHAILRGEIVCSGLVAGDSTTGVIIAFLASLGWIKSSGEGYFSNGLSFLMFILLATIVYKLAVKKIHIFKA
jgi:putative OPT family oligopeptide transporter